MIKYSIGISGQVLIIRDVVIEHFRWYRQHRWYQREAGGQLFARFASTRIVIEQATGPRRDDRRTRASFIPDRAGEQREIFDRHGHGLHYVGDWHTHPEACPKPSRIDFQNIAECVEKSQHGLNGFILVIVGQMQPPSGLHVSLHDGKNAFTLDAQNCVR